MVQISGRDIATNDVGIMGAGAVVLVSSFLPWYGVSYAGNSASSSGWGSGFTAWFPILLVVVAAGTVAARVFGNVQLPATGPVGPALRIVVAGGVATLLVLIRWLTLPDASDTLFAAEIETGARVGLFLGLIGAAALTAFAVLALRTSGEAVPGRSPKSSPGGPYGQ